MVMTPIDMVSKFIYIPYSDAVSEVRIECNYCAGRVVFFEGRKTDMPDTPWLTDAITHVLNVHSDKLERFSNG